MNKLLLIIGKPHSSKTVFIAQFYSRLQKRKSKLSLYKSVNDLSPITLAREALAKGEEPQATPTNRSVNLILPIQFGDQQIDLLCPDYGGEQINNIITSREVDKKWINLLRRFGLSLRMALNRSCLLWLMKRVWRPLSGRVCV